MAIRYAVAAGNWSANATWDGGAALPTAGDDVYANGFTVTINQHITVAKISTELCPTTGLAGGQFNIATFIVTANIVAGTTRCVNTTGAGNPTFIGNIYGGTGTGANGVYVNNLGSISVIGNVYGGSGVDAAGIGHYNLTAAIITGNIYGGNGTEGMLRYLGGGVINVTGNITAGVFSGVKGVADMNIIGNVASSPTAHGILASTVTSALINITGKLINYQEKLAIAGYSRIYFYPSTSTAWTFYSSDNIAKPLYTADVVENPPAESDVRVGVVYGIGDVYTGTLEVGGATPAEFVAALDASDLGQRMAKCAITEEVLTMLENL